MLVQSQQTSGALGGKDYKRSLSLLDNNSKKTMPKRTATMESQNRKKTNKITTEEDSDDNTPKKANATASFGIKK